MVFRQHPSQFAVAVGERAMRVLGLRRGLCEAMVERLAVVFQEGVGLLQGGQALQAQLLDQPVLDGLKQPLDAPLGLRRLSADGLNAQLAQD